MPKERILIGVPGFNGLQPEAQESFMGMVFRCGRDLPQYDFAVRIETKREQFRARNGLIDGAIGMGATYLLMLDDDMIVPSDLLARLLAHDKDLVGALYWQRGGAYHPVLMRAVSLENGDFHADFYSATDPIIQQPGLYPVDIIGGGCMLFKVDCFRKLTPPYFWWEHHIGTDIAICTRFREVGIQPYIDTTIELGHLMSDRDVITRADIPLALQAMGRMKEELIADTRTYFGMAMGELESCAFQASQLAARQQRWNEKPRDTWEQIRSFYTDYGDWHVLNLFYFGCTKHPQLVQWLLTEAKNTLPEGSTILDLGPGIGVPAIHLAASHGYNLICAELEGAATLKFLQWRKQFHKLEDSTLGTNTSLDIWTFPGPVPHFQTTVDCVVMLSMLDHCVDAYATLEWAIAQLRPGGVLLCDYATATKEFNNEPQHLITYDQFTLPQWFKAHGMDVSPKHPDWMLIKR